jgi:Ca2+-binding RTX toxin-like protein
MHLDGFTPPSSTYLRFYVGNFNFFGVSTVGACVEYGATPGPTSFHLVLDQDNHLLGWLPQTYNSLCLTGNNDEIRILTQSETHCGVNMTPLNYNGHELDLAGLDGNDHLHGGNGVDVLYGGNGIDDLSDDSQTPGNNPIYQGVLYGENGNDFLFGSPANNTYLNGGNDNDALADEGGTGDFHIGGYGNECCIYDSNDSGNIWCEAGTDTVRSLAGTHNCETASTSCAVNLWSCM